MKNNKDFLRVLDRFFLSIYLKSLIQKKQSACGFFSAGAKFRDNLPNWWNFLAVFNVHDTELLPKSNFRGLIAILKQHVI